MDEIIEMLTKFGNDKKMEVLADIYETFRSQKENYELDPVKYVEPNFTFVMKAIQDKIIALEG